MEHRCVAPGFLVVGYVFLTYYWYWYAGGARASRIPRSVAFFGFCLGVGLSVLSAVALYERGGPSEMWRGYIAVPTIFLCSVWLGYALLWREQERVSSTSNS